MRANERESDGVGELGGSDREGHLRPRRSNLLAFTLLLVFVGAINTLCMPAMLYFGDPSTWREEAKSILRGHLSVEQSIVDRFNDPTTASGRYYVQNESTGLEYSKYGIANSLLSIPPLAIDAWRHGRLPERGSEDLLVFNVYQLLLTLIECGLLYWLTGIYTRRTVVRVIYVLSVFYGTYFWYYQRAHGGEIFQVILFTALVACFTAYLRKVASLRYEPTGATRLELLASWAMAGALVMCRILFGLLLPSMVILATALIWREKPPRRWAMLRREAPYLLIPPVVIVGLLGWVNTVKFGAPWCTGYHIFRPEQHLPIGSLWEGLYGFTVDMQGSAFWYFPVLIFALAGSWQFCRRRPVDALAITGLFFPPFIVLCLTPSWLGEWTYGPRYIVFGLPVLGLPMIDYLERILAEPRRWLRWALGTLTAAVLLYSAYLQERVNRLNFFAYYYLANPLERGWDSQIGRYFLLHHRGVICAELYAKRDNLDDFTVVQIMKSLQAFPAVLEEYKSMLRKQATFLNYYWFTERDPGLPPDS